MNEAVTIQGSSVQVALLCVWVLFFIGRTLYDIQGWYKETKRRKLKDELHELHVKQLAKMDEMIHYKKENGYRIPENMHLEYQKLNEESDVLLQKLYAK